jgi:O-antigen/teichoic acid export membrane protein
MFRNIKDRHILDRILSAGMWVGLGTAIASLLNFAIGLLVARFLTKAAYGEYVLLQSTVGTLGILAGFGIGTTVVRYVAELKTGSPERLSRVISICRFALFIFAAIASTVTFVASDYIGAAVLNNVALSIPIKYCAPVILFSAFDAYFKSILLGLESLKRYTVATVAGIMLSLPVIVYGASTANMENIALALSFSAALQAILSYLFANTAWLRMGLPSVPAICLQEAVVLRAFAVPAALSGIMVAPAHWATQALLTRTASGYEQIAVLGIAMQWFGIIMFIPTNVSRVVLPILSSMPRHGGASERLSTLRFSVAINGAISGALLIGVCLFSSQIMALYGEQYRTSESTMIFIALAALLLAVQTPIGNLLAANGDMWLGTRMNFVWAFIYVGMSSALMSYGARGVSMALLAGYLVHTILTFRYAKQSWS